MDVFSLSLSFSLGSVAKTGAVLINLITSISVCPQEFAHLPKKNRLLTNYSPIFAYVV